MIPNSSTKRPIAVDLFAGAGGLSLGFEWAGFDVAAAVEYDPIHCATHEYNFPSCAPICRSVSDIDGAYIREHSRIARREIEVVFGGAPCQGFSLIGKRSLDDPRNRLVYDFVRLVVDLQPRYFVFENVKGLAIGAHRKFLHEIIEEFQRRGYDVNEEVQVLNAAEFGVPQERHRLFLLGSRKGIRPPRYPRSTHQFRASASSELPPSPVVRDAISDLPNADDYPELLERDWVLADFGDPSSYANQLRQAEPFSSNRSNREMLTSSLRTVHTPLSIARFSQTRPGEVEPVSRFLRLDLDGVSNTLRAGTASDRGAFTSPRPIHPVYPRCITVREAARIHSYPDWFRFHVTKWHGFRQVGNSVPPLLASAVARSISECVGVLTTAPTRQSQTGDAALLSMNMSEAAARYGVPGDVIPARQRMPNGAAHA